MISPTNLAFSIMFSDIISVFLYIVSTGDIEILQWLCFFMITSYIATFFVFLFYHVMWFSFFAPGNYWYEGLTYVKMFESYLVPFYLVQSGLLAPLIGFYLISTHAEAIDISWVIIGVVFTIPLTSILFLETRVCRRYKQM